MDTLWARDQRGRIVLRKSRGSQGRKTPHLVIAVSTDGQVAAIGSEVPDDLTGELQAAIANGPAPADPATQPASIARCQELLQDSLGPVELSANPAYLIPAETVFKSTAEIVRSDRGDAEVLRSRAPERAGWSPDEWKGLLDGDFGPWAFALVEGKVVSICHSPAVTDRGAEAGTWTDPDFRGRGYAAATTAAWASLFRNSHRFLFYSTSAGNLSSQRVAARLMLHPIGWRWQISTPPTA
jgi:RimJ/RimL family protein N-acetyltransferase